METGSSEGAIRDPRRRRLGLGLAVLYFLVCLAYAGRSAFRDQPPNFHVDFECWYVEGACFLHGESPFNMDAYQDRWAKVIGPDVYDYKARGMPKEWTSFGYLPTQAVLMAPLALLKYYPARCVFNALSFLSLLITLYLTGLFLVRSRVCRWDTPLLWVGMGTACSLNSGVPAALFVGQPTMLAMAGTMGVVYYWLRKRTVLASLCMIVSSFKVPIGICSLANLFCRGAYVAVVAGAVLCAVISVGFLATTPHEAIVPDAVKTVKYFYSQHPMANPPNVTGLVALAHAMGLVLPKSTWILGGVILSALVGWLNRNEPFFPANAEEGEAEAAPSRRLGNLVRYDGWYLPFLITGLFVQLKLYDSIIYTPIIVGAFAAGSWRGLWYAPGLIIIGRMGFLLQLAQRVCSQSWLASLGQTLGDSNHPLKMIETVVASAAMAWVVLTHIALKWVSSREASANSAVEVHR
jgi:hypothetical protein